MDTTARLGWTSKAAVAGSLAGALIFSGAVPASADAPAADVTKPVISSVGLADGQVVRGFFLILPTAEDDIGVTRLEASVVNTPAEPYANSSCTPRATVADGWVCRTAATSRPYNEAESVITLRAYDAAGNGSDPAVVHVHVDNKEPRFTLDPAPMSSTRSGPVTVRLVDVPADTASVRVLDGPAGTVLTTLTAAPWTYEWNATNDATPPCFVADDRVGNRYQQCADYVVDDEAPIITRVDFEGSYSTNRLDTGTGWVGGVSGVVPTIADESPIVRTEWRVNGVLTSTEPVFTWDARRSTTPTATVEVRVWDAASNTAVKSFPVSIDKAAPAMTVYPAERALIRGTTFISSIKAADRAGIAYINLENPLQNGPTTSVRLATGQDGARKLTWIGIDRLGNYAYARRTVIIDNTAPALKVTKAPKNKAKLTKTAALTAAASDRNGIARVQLLVNGKVVATDTRAGYTFKLNPKRYGKTFTVRLRAYDKAGNVRYTAKRTYHR